MARRRQHQQGHDRDEVHAGGGGSTGTLLRPSGTNVRDHLLSLQRSYGNGAVTTIVQRKGGAASTDAPGYHPPKKEKPSAKKKGPTDEEKFTPKPDASLSSLDVSALSQAESEALGHAADPAQVDSRRVWLQKAAHYDEQAWLRTPGKPARGYATAAMRVYRDLGDTARIAFWSKVASGELDPKAPKPEAAPPGSDQHF